jgi:endonuclease/exonuclease/phosphatase family metal-dependent hydrolase/glycosyltransferase involved in cell wall biosynthesis
MKILMMTNSYAPMVGGIEESIRTFTHEFEKLGHEVIIVAPECDGAPLDEVGVIRLRAIQHINHSDFGIALPMSSLLPELLKTFMPDIIHCHHPFWIGDIALRLSSKNSIPLVFTYHTMFEQHMHYLPIQNDAMKRFIVELFTGYANLANQVIVPSESVRTVLLERGVTTEIEVIPTGVDLQKFAFGNGEVIRKRLGIPLDAVVIGFIGRLAQEKNLTFLSESIAAYIKKKQTAHFLLGGDGPLKDEIKAIFEKEGVANRLHFAGMLHGQDLVDCYHAMNIFSCASLSETQGIVLIEAMAAGIPVVAIDAPGVREVVKDGYNGRLIFDENKDTFIKALVWCLTQPEKEFREMKENARATTKEFAREFCAKKMIKTYQDLKVKEYVSSARKDNIWYSLVERLKNEWDMFKNVLYAGVSVADVTALKEPLQKKERGLFLKIPQLLSLREWSAKVLRLPRIEKVETEPGLVLIQIDGLSQSQLKSACAHKKMPFVHGLFKKQYYHVHPHYSGLPSSTPAVQGELFYGVKQMVPAFAFFDREKAKIFRMYDSDAVMEIERRLKEEGTGLLEGGSSYSNIYTGGAKEAHFCATSLGWGQIGRDIGPLKFILFIATRIPSALRIFVLTVFEMMLGIVDFWRGVFKGENLQKEITFFYLRVLICILLRDLVTLGVKMDIVRGLPIIHVNLLGYDELSHNSGPSSRLAHWALHGIDRAIENIYHNAVHASRRRYDVWIYSDHGQEEAVSYVKKYNCTVQKAVAEVFKEFDATAVSVPFDETGEQLQRARLYAHPAIRKTCVNVHDYQDELAVKKLVVTAIGPTGNIYVPQKMNRDELGQFARALVDKAHIPVVMVPELNGTVRVWNKKGEYELPQDAETILGDKHPFLHQVTEDLIGVCHHANAGDITFIGFSPGNETITFPFENGAHAGPGPEETNGFALLPIDIMPKQTEATERNYITPTDLRIAALRFLKRPVSLPAKSRTRDKKARVPIKETKTIRIMTYNVHSCVGRDGKLSPERIARVIRRHEPDIVALQELDMGRKRTSGADQPHLIAKELEMMYHFYPSIVVDSECYGNAVLSRYPMELVRAGRLPSIIKSRIVESRGVIWTIVDIEGTPLQVINTHLGYLPHEGNVQIKALLGPEWVGHPACKGAVVLCGDFNALPRSRVCSSIKKVFRDAQEGSEQYGVKESYFRRFPMGRIDHVFVSPHIEVAHVEVSRTDLDTIASDHFPLIVDITLTK